MVRYLVLQNSLVEGWPAQWSFIKASRLEWWKLKCIMTIPNHSVSSTLLSYYHTRSPLPIWFAPPKTSVLISQTQMSLQDLDLRVPATRWIQHVFAETIEKPIQIVGFVRTWSANLTIGLITKTDKKIDFDILGLDDRFVSFPAGSGQDFWRRIRIWGQICWILASRGQNLRKTT